MNLPRWIAAGCVLAATAAPAGAADEPAKGFVNRVFKDDEGESKYVLFVPHDYKPGTAYPIMLFLHGAGETGSDGEKQAKVGIGPAIKKNEKTFPFIVVMPQASHAKVPVLQRWFPDQPDGKRALVILEEVQKEFKTDPKRVYITGLSMGGFGTWAMAQTYPEKWAAAAPICGGGDPKQAEKLKDLPIWCFHGDADNVVRPDGSRNMVEAIKKAGGKPKYDEYPGVGHNSWDKAYATKEFYDWLLEQKLK
jgi:predicted peptidase